MNKDKKVSVEQYITRREEILTRLNELADKAEAEKREFSEPEKEEIKQLKRESEVLSVRINSADKLGNVTYTTREQLFDNYIREAVLNKMQTGGALKREFTGQDLAGAAAGGIVPLSINDIIKPLEDGLILSKIGIPLMTGLAGDYVWPVVGSVEATLNGEAVALTDSKVDMSKIKPVPNRVGISISITNQTLTQTDGVALAIVKTQLPMGVTRLLNRIMFCTEKYSDTMFGPFDAATVKVTLETMPTFKDLLQMKGKVLAKGVEGDSNSFCFVMSELMKATLEATPRGAGGERMIIEDDKIGPYPIFCTNYINQTKLKGAVVGERIGFGNFAFEPMGQFGETRFIVDPFTMAGSDTTKLVLNSDWSMTTLRKEAFAVMTTPAIA